MDHLDKLNTLNNYIRIYDNVLPTATLNKFLKICENNKNFFSPGGIVSDTVEGSVNKKVRNTLVWDLANSEAEESKTNVHWCNLWICLFGKYLKRYEKEIEVDVRANINTIQVLKYMNEGHYMLHVDHGSTIPRTLSFIFFVNDDYEGGELSFALPNFSGISNVEKKSNRMVVWPSNFLFPHGVKPVVKGTRYSVVAWAL